MIATSGAHAVRARTARTAASIIRPAGRPTRAARRAGARAARESRPCRPETAAALRRAAARPPPGRTRLVHDTASFGLGLTQDHLRFALGRGARLLAQLLRRDQRLVHGALTLP